MLPFANHFPNRRRFTLALKLITPADVNPNRLPKFCLTLNIRRREAILSNDTVRFLGFNDTEVGKKLTVMYDDESNECVICQDPKGLHAIRFKDSRRDRGMSLAVFRAFEIHIPEEKWKSQDRLHLEGRHIQNLPVCLNPLRLIPKAIAFPWPDHAPKPSGTGRKARHPRPHKTIFRHPNATSAATPIEVQFAEEVAEKITALEGGFNEADVNEIEAQASPVETATEPPLPEEGTEPVAKKKQRGRVVGSKNKVRKSPTSDTTPVKLHVAGAKARVIQQRGPVVSGMENIPVVVVPSPPKAAPIKRETLDGTFSEIQIREMVGGIRRFDTNGVSSASIVLAVKLAAEGKSTEDIGGQLKVSWGRVGFWLNVLSTNVMHLSMLTNPEAQEMYERVLFEKLEAMSNAK